MRPNRLILRAYASRGTRLWLITRTLLTGVFLLAGSNPFRLSPITVAAIILLSVALGFLESHRHGERALLGNMGVRPLMLGALFAAPAVAGEVALHLTGAALR